MNTHPVEAHRVGDHYTAHFYVIWRQSEPFTVCDDDGKPVLFPSWEKATIAAYQARDAAEDGRYRHWNGIEQAEPAERWWNLKTRKLAQQKQALAAKAKALFERKETA